MGLKFAIMADGKSTNEKKGRAILKAAFWGGVIAVVMEIVLVHAAIDDWGYAVGIPKITDYCILVAFILSFPALFLEKVSGFLQNSNEGTEIYLTAFLSIILCAITFAAVTSFWQFILRGKSGNSN